MTQHTDQEISDADILRNSREQLNKETEEKISALSARCNKPGISEEEHSTLVNEMILVFANSWKSQILLAMRSFTGECQVNFDVEKVSVSDLVNNREIGNQFREFFRKYFYLYSFFNNIEDSAYIESIDAKEEVIKLWTYILVFAPAGLDEVGDVMEMAKIYTCQVVKEQIERYDKKYNAILRHIGSRNENESDEDSLKEILEKYSQKRTEFINNQSKMVH